MLHVRAYLSYLHGSETVWRSDDCLTYYGTKIQNSPIKDNTDFKLTPYTDLQYYQHCDENDPHIAFVEGIYYYKGTAKRTSE